MEYQLVLRFSASGLKDFDELVKIEDLLISSLGNLALVDGHDMGSGEASIFIITKDPKATFEKVKTALGAKKIIGMKAGFRKITEENYIPMWPDNLSSFSVK